MKTKDSLLELFQANRGKYLSGEELASSLGVSRTSIWKAVKKLKEEGYIVDAVTNKGYCLLEGKDILSIAGIESYLDEQSKNVEIEIFDELLSTNDYLKNLDINSLKDEHIVITNYQSKGRGRLGKSFYSPKNTGIYFSMLLKPEECYSAKALRLTTMAAVSMCEAIEDVTHLHPQIKWVNDIFVNRRKVCGILTEGQFGLENGLLQYAILGIGINVYKPDCGFPEEIKNIAGYLLEDNNDDFKNRLMASFINHFNYYYLGRVHNYTDKYRQLSLVIGREITITLNNRQTRVRVLGIDDECRLIVKNENGEIKTLAYGEIQIKL